MSAVALPGETALAAAPVLPEADAGGDDAGMLLLTKLRKSVWAGRESVSPLDRAFCALIAALDPQCRIRSLYEALPHQAATLTTSDLLDALANLGFIAQTVTCRLSEVEPRVMPCLFLAEKDRLAEPASPLVVTGIRRNGRTVEADVFEGATGQRRTLMIGATADDMRGTLFVWRRFNADSLNTSRFRRQSTGHTWFRAVLSRFMRDFAAVFFLGLVINTVALATPLFIMLVYDRVIAARAIETLPILLAGMLCALIVEWMLRSTRSRAISWIASRIDWIVGTSIFGRLLSLPPAYVERASVPAQVARLKTFEAIREMFSGSVFFAVLEMPFVFVALWVIWIIAGPLVVVPLLMIVPYAALFALARRKIMVSIRIVAKEISARQSFTIETLRRYESIRVNGLTDKWLAKHRSLSGRENISRFHLNLLGAMAETLSHGLMSIAAIATLSVGAFLVWEGEVTTGALVASMILVWRVLSPLYSLCTMVPRIEQVRNSIRQVNDLMDLREETASDQILPRIVRLKGMLAFDNVSFRYSAETDPVFEGLSFGGKPGAFIVISGNNGSGKSSLLKLARGQYRAQAGTVRLDGFDLRQLDPQEVRRQIGYVPQSPDFFPGTIAENFRLVRPTATDEDIWAALAPIGADADVAALPEGLATPIGDVMSTTLRHKLNFARALIVDPSILLVDEQPSSMLTGITGLLLKEFISANRGKRTIVFVASRADFLRLADTVVLLERYRRPVAGTPDAIFERLKRGRGATFTII